jgi:hypothetical protein
MLASELLSDTRQKGSLCLALNYLIASAKRLPRLAAASPCRNGNNLNQLQPFFQQERSSVSANNNASWHLRLMEITRFWNRMTFFKLF